MADPARMAFGAKWGKPVKDAVRELALSPDMPTARQIREGLLAGAVPGIEPADVPPHGTIADWVTDHRRSAREALGGVAQASEDLRTLEILERRARKLARDSRTAGEVRDAARALREVSMTRREIAKREPDADVADARPIRGARPGDQAERRLLAAWARPNGASTTQETSGTDASDNDAE